MNRTATICRVVAVVAAVTIAVLALGVAPAHALGFLPGVQYATGTSPAVVVGDFNADGKQDLATANFGSGNVSVLLGNGDGTFAAKVDYAAGAQTWSVVVGDLNRDGKQDLVTTNQGPNTLSVLLGNGDGTFAAKVDYATGSDPTGAALVDLNRDGKPDLVTACQLEGTVRVHLGNGDGTLAAGALYATGSLPSDVAAGDFDGDGNADLAVAVQSSNTVGILRGTGSGAFSLPTTYATGATPSWVAVGDLDGDGALDLAVANRGGGSVSVLIGSGSGTFAARADYATAATPNSVAIGDLNGDGRRDLVTGDYSTVSVLLGVGGGAFGASTIMATPYGGWSAAIGDLNRDGRPDLVKADGGTVTVCLNDAAAPSGTTQLAGGAAATAGRLVSVDSSVADAVDMRLRDAGGSWGAWQPYAAQVYWNVPAGDGDKTVEAQYRNGYGQTATLSDSILLDTTPPTTTDNSPAGWQTTDFKVELTPDDGAGSGVADTQFKVDDDAWSHGTMASVAGDGVHTVRYRSIDAVGNREETQSCTAMIDTTAPTTTVHGADTLWHAWPQTVFLTADDGAGSGMSGGAAKIEYDLDSAGWVTGDWILITDDGDHSLQVRATDAAGNVEAPQTAHVEIDRTPPTTTDDAPATWTNQQVTVTLTPTDGGSGMSGGLATTQYSTDGGTTWTTGVSVVVDPDPVNHSTDHLTVYYRSTDAVGNVEATKSCLVRIDTQGPTTSGAKVSVRKGKKATLKVKATDPQPGSPSADLTIKIRNARGKTVKTIDVPGQATNATVLVSFTCKLAKGTYRYKVYAVDAAGNAAVKVGGNKLIVR